MFEHPTILMKTKQSESYFFSFINPHLPTFSDIAFFLFFFTRLIVIMYTNSGIICVNFR